MRQRETVRDRETNKTMKDTERHPYTETDKEYIYMGTCTHMQ